MEGSFIKKEFIVERQGQTFVRYAGILDEAHEQGLKSIVTELVQTPNQDNRNTAICKAIVETSKGIFTGIGDAAPDNVGRAMQNCLIRMAETRAKARALRDAINVGVAALEELDESESGEVSAPKPLPRPQVVPGNKQGVSNTSASAANKSTTKTPVASEEQKSEISSLIKETGIEKAEFFKYLETKHNLKNYKELNSQQATDIINWLKNKLKNNVA